MMTTNRGRKRKAGATTAAAFALTCLALCLALSTSLNFHSDCRRGKLPNGVVDSRTSTTARIAGHRRDSTVQYGGRLQRLRLPAKFDDDGTSDEDYWDGKRNDAEADGEVDDEEYLEKFDLGDLTSDVQIPAGGTDRSLPRAPAAVPSSSSDADEMRKMMERQQSQIDALMSMMMNQQQLLQLQSQQTQQKEMTSAPRAAPQGPGPSVTPLKAFLFIDGTWLYYSMHTRGGDRDPIERKFGKGWRNHYKVDW